MFLVLLLLPSTVLSLTPTRFQASQDKRVTGVLSGEEYFDTVGGCANYCTRQGVCQAFSTRLYQEDSGEKFRGFKCQTAYSNYTGNIETNSGWVLWEKKTETSSPRSAATVVSPPSVPECPVVWRQWPSDNATLGVWTASMSNSEGSNVAANAIDNDETSMAQTRTDYNYPYLAIDLGRSIRVSKVAVLGGDDVTTNPLLNLEVRVGEINKAGSEANTKFTDNTRCGVFYGPTLVSSQWVEVDCGYSRGILGRFVSLQLADRFIPSGGGRLELKEIQIFGWGRQCGDSQP